MRCVPDAWKRKGRCRNGAAISDARWRTLHKISGWERCVKSSLHLLLSARQAVQLHLPNERWSPAAVRRLARNARPLLHKLKNPPRTLPQKNGENPRRCPFKSLVVLLIYSFLVKDILHPQKSPVYFVFKIQLRIFNIPMIWSRIWRDLWLFCADVHWTVGDFLCKNPRYGCII